MCVKMDTGVAWFENEVAKYVKETDNHVLYRVTPIFENDNLLAKGVQIEAQSIENNEIKLENVEFEILDKDGNVLEKIKTNKEGEAVTSVYPVRDFEELYIKENCYK